MQTHINSIGGLTIVLVDESPIERHYLTNCNLSIKKWLGEILAQSSIGGQDSISIFSLSMESHSPRGAIG